MDRAQKPGNSECYTPPSEPFREQYDRNFEEGYGMQKQRFTHDDDDYDE
jgi:hypothetical protein